MALIAGHTTVFDAGTSRFQLLAKESPLDTVLFSGWALDSSRCVRCGSPSTNYTVPFQKFV